MAKEGSKLTPVTVNFDDKQRAKLAAIAEREDRSLAGQIRHLVSRALEQQGRGDCSMSVRPSIRGFALALVFLALISIAPPAHAAVLVMCSSGAAGSQKASRVSNPTGGTYPLDQNGCALMAQSDVPYFRTQGFTPGAGIGVAYAGGITANTTAINSPVLPANAYIDNIVINETAGNAVTGGVDIGTAASGTQIASAVAVGANALVPLADTALLKRVFNSSGTPVAQQIFFTCHTGCNSASLNITILWRYF